MKRLFIIIPLLALVLVAAQCASKSKETVLSVSAIKEVSNEAVESPAYEAEADAAEGEAAQIVQVEVAADDSQVEQAANGKGPSTVTPWDRKIIKTANVKLETDEVFNALSQITFLSSRYGGYVVNSKTWYQHDYPYANYSFAVPVTDFENALAEVRGFGKVLNETTTGQDVSGKYVDLEARIRNLEVTANRIRNFMDETETIQEALTINEELIKVETELERLKGQRNALAQQSAFSTINVEITPFMPPIEPEPAPQPEPVPVWSAVVTFQAALAVLLNILQNLTDIAIWALVIGLPLILIAWPAWLIGRRVATQQPGLPGK